MNEDAIIQWLLQYSTIWTALLIGLASVMVANFKRRSIIGWYLYGFTCTLVAWPLITLPTIHAFLLHRPTTSPEARQRRQRADALALLAEDSVRSYPTWIAELKRKSPEGVDRRRYIYENIRPGDSIELIREDVGQPEHAVAFRHRGINLGYVPKPNFWVTTPIAGKRGLLRLLETHK